MIVTGGQSRYRRRIVAALCIMLPATARTAPATDEQRDPPVDTRKQDDLSERLIRESVSASEEDMMDRIIRLMSASARQLEIEFDAGEETQVLQQRISKELDDAIKLAATRMRRSTRSDPTATGDERRHREEPGVTRQGNAKTGENSAEGVSSDSATESTDTTTPGLRPDAPFRESRRGWGHLPRRQREEVLQGIGEQFLERYRDWVERYYRALQESEE